MSNVRQALTGILAALISAVIIFGSIILALSETGHKIARLPESNPLLSTPMPPVATSKPGEPTYTAAPTSRPRDACRRTHLTLREASRLATHRSAPRRYTGNVGAKLRHQPEDPYQGNCLDE